MSNVQINVQLNLQKTASRPPLAFVLRCFEWTAGLPEFEIPGQTVRGVSRQTRAEIQEGKKAPVKKANPGPEDQGEDLYVKSLPSGCRFLETGYTTEMTAKGWRKLTLDAWQEATGLRRDYLEQIYDRTYYPFRFLNNKAPDCQDTIIAEGATVQLNGDDRRTAGKLWLGFEALRGDGKAPALAGCNPWDNPRMWFRLTTSRRQGYTGRGLLWTDEHWQGGWDYLTDAMPVPLLSPTGRNWLPEDRMRVLAADEPIPAPYYR
jgi:hypothetical protein